MDRFALPSAACLGGGTGLSTMLRGLKRFTPNITAIVAVTDDGGGSGVLRRELGMLPPGDIRNCIQALSDDEGLMTRLLGYRFSDGSLAHQSFGNLFLAAMNGISGSFDEAVARVGEVLAITGSVMPVTNENRALCAELEDGSLVVGQSTIGAAKAQHGCRIKRISLVPDGASALPGSIRAIEDADLIVIGPGSLYTSVIPNLLVSGVAEAIERSNAVKLYVCNIMTQPGETEGYSVTDHIEALCSHAGRNLIDCCLINSARLPDALLDKYKQTEAGPITYSPDERLPYGIEACCADIAAHDSVIARHEPILLAREIIRIFRARSHTRRFGG